MRLVAVICAVLTVGLARPAVGQVYPYLSTIPVADLIAQTQETEPQDLAFDSVGNRLLIVEGANQIVQILDGTSFAPLATIGTAGVSGADSTHLFNPGGVAVDNAGNRILVADTGNDRVQLFDAGSLALVGTLGVAASPGADGAHLSGPTGVALDVSNNHIVVADTANDRVQLFDAASLTLLGTIGVAGTPGADNGHLSGPTGVALDPVTGHLLIADTGNGRIQVYDARSAGYIGTIDQVGNVTSLGIDITGRHLFAADPTDYDFIVIDADALVPVSMLGLVGSSGLDNARFVAPSGIGFDPATGRIFAGDAILNRIQVFGQPSWLVAATAPGGRAVQVGEPASVFATILNTGATDFNNCQIALPNDAPQGLTLTFQTTSPTTNLSTGQPNQPVTIAAGTGQSFVLTLTADAPVTAIGESFLFSCDGTTPAPIFSGVNTADLTVSADPTADIIAAAATPDGSGTISVPETSAPATAFPVAAFNFGASESLQVSVDSGSFYPATSNGPASGFEQTLPINVLICQTNPFTGQCLASPAAQLTVNFPSGGTATFNVFVSATGIAIPASLSEPRLFLRFNQPTGAPLPDSVGITSVAIVTQSNQ
jgi:DNA-binding beta-propeller fold protein YncE